MFYDLSNSPVSNIRRQKRVFNFKTSTADQEKCVANYLENSRKQSISHASKQRKTLFKKQNVGGLITDTNSRKYSNIKYPNSNSTLHSLIKENQSLKLYLINMISNSHQKSTIDKSQFQNSKINNSIYGLTENYQKQPEFQILEAFTKERSFDKQHSQLASQRRLHQLAPQFQVLREGVGKMGRDNLSKAKMERDKENIMSQSSISRHYQISSIKGTKRVNQDTIKTGDNIWIVCDGHGQRGHNVSWYVANMLYDSYLQQKGRQNLSTAKLINMFCSVEKNLEQSNIDVTLSGSTCVMVIAEEDKIYCACLGDSGAVAIYEDQSHQIISANHKPCNPDEAKRIDFFGGVIKKTVGKQHIPLSPLRIWGQGRENWGPGLAISRSFGDKMAQKYGLIYEPQVREVEITRQLKYIVLGSDGLFDQVKPSQMSQVLRVQEKTLAKKDGCQLLTEMACSRWVGYSDDISCVVIYF